jgi:hypothetical protein
MRRGAVFLAEASGAGVPPQPRTTAPPDHRPSRPPPHHLTTSPPHHLTSPPDHHLTTPAAHRPSGPAAQRPSGPAAQRPSGPAAQRPSGEYLRAAAGGRSIAPEPSKAGVFAEPPWARSRYRNALGRRFLLWARVSITGVSASSAAMRSKGMFPQIALKASLPLVGRENLLMRAGRSDVSRFHARGGVVPCLPESTGPREPVTWGSICHVPSSHGRRPDPPSPAGSRRPGRLKGRERRQCPRLWNAGGRAISATKATHLSRRRLSWIAAAYLRRRLHCRWPRNRNWLRGQPTSVPTAASAPIRLRAQGKCHKHLTTARMAWRTPPQLVRAATYLRSAAAAWGGRRVQSAVPAGRSVRVAALSLFRTVLVGRQDAQAPVGGVRREAHRRPRTSQPGICKVELAPADAAISG